MRHLPAATPGVDAPRDKHFAIVVEKEDADAPPVWTLAKGEPPAHSALRRAATAVTGTTAMPFFASAGSQFASRSMVTGKGRPMATAAPVSSDPLGFGELLLDALARDDIIEVHVADDMEHA